MATTKNLCAQIPIDLHERVSEERERLGQTISEYIANLIQDYTIECSLYVCILLRFVQVLVLVVGMSNLITRVLLVKMDQLTTKHDML